jgi:hypothetical protein
MEGGKIPTPLLSELCYVLISYRVRIE